MDENFRLCYVKGDWAYFTTQALNQQWGDDWNDAPYEHNAGKPYTWKPLETVYLPGAERKTEVRPNSVPEWKIGKVAYEVQFETPSSYASNSGYSVQMINAGIVPWLQTDRYSLSDGRPVIRIMGGTTYPEFVRLILEGGGMVYEAIK